MHLRLRKGLIVAVHHMGSCRCKFERLDGLVFLHWYCKLSKLKSMAEAHAAHRSGATKHLVTHARAGGKVQGGGHRHRFNSQTVTTGITPASCCCGSIPAWADSNNFTMRLMQAGHSGKPIATCTYRHMQHINKVVQCVTAVGKLLPYCYCYYGYGWATLWSTCRGVTIESHSVLQATVTIASKVTGGDK